MPAEQVFPNAAAFRDELKRLRAERKMRKDDLKDTRPIRRALSPTTRSKVLEKTKNRCHICGGEIGKGEAWHADHVRAHSGGGTNDVDNYLPAHAICNNYRWDYANEEFQWILKLGVWLRTEVERDTEVGKNAAEQFVEYERRRADRRKKTVNRRESTPATVPPHASRPHR